jgi:hypothetical protein
MHCFASWNFVGGKKLLFVCNFDKKLSHVMYVLWIYPKSMISSFIYLCTFIFEKTHLDLITCQKDALFDFQRISRVLIPLPPASKATTPAPST